MKIIPRQWILLLVAIFLILFLRAPDLLIFPPLQVEDGVDVFAYFYEHREFGQIFRAKNGYIPLVANLIGYLSVRLPTRLIPYGLAWLPFIITLLAYSRFFSQRYRSVLPSDTSRALVCILFALAPLAQYHLLAHTDYSIWNTLLLLILLSVLPLPARRSRAVLTWLGINLLIWSHPLAVIILPFQILCMIRDKTRRRFYQLTLVNLLAHQLLGVRSGHLLLEPGFLGMISTFLKALLATLVIASKIAFRSAFGQPLFGFVNKSMGFLMGGWAMLVVAATSVMFWHCPRYRLVIATLAYLILSVTFLTIITRGLAAADPIANGVRYVYLQSLAFLVLWVVLADVGISSLLTRSRCALPRFFQTPHNHGWRAGIFLVFILHYYLLNTQRGHYFLFNTQPRSPYYAAHPGNGKIVFGFFQELALAEQLHGRDGFRLVADKINDWPIVIDTRVGAK